MAPRFPDADDPAPNPVVSQDTEPRRYVRFDRSDGLPPVHLLPGIGTFHLVPPSNSLTNFPAQGPVEWNGDNFSRLVLVGRNPFVEPFPPLDPPTTASSGAGLFTQALEFAWQDGSLGDRPVDLDMVAPAPLAFFFPGDIGIARSVDIGECSLPIPWVISPSRPSPPLYTALSGLLGFVDGGGAPLGFAQLLLDQLATQLQAEEGRRDRDGAFFATTERIDRVDDEEFWFRMGREPAEDDFCVESRFDLRGDIRLGRVLPVRTRCDKRISLRVCGRFDVDAPRPGDPGTIAFTLTEVDTARESAGAVCRRYLNRFREVLEDEVNTTFAATVNTQFNVALTTAGVPLRRVEHMPSRFELVFTEFTGQPRGGALDFLSTTNPICRDDSNWVPEAPVELIDFENGIPVL